mmetsp:Transcript_46300/g.82741  ORF Transcript_46300/g.82741 Transcript_46300/m.82741 type:complete len:81 (-) Transcript_46300:114-356(-)
MANSSLSLTLMVACSHLSVHTMFHSGFLRSGTLIEHPVRACPSPWTPNDAPQTSVVSLIGYEYATDKDFGGVAQRFLWLP